MTVQSSSISLIILNFNTQGWVEKCLRSIKKFHLAFTNHPTTVFVVDNGSTDNSLAALQKEFKWVKFIATGQNLGFAAGNNVALRQVNTTYAMLLNSDTELTANTHLDGLIEYMDAQTQVAVVTPRLELVDGSLDWASHRGEPTLWASLTYFAKLEKILPMVPLFSQYHLKTRNLTQTHQIDACSGAAMMVRSSAMKKVGFLDESFFMYAEDLDWCRRFRQAGFKITFNPSSTVIHHKYKSGLKNKDQKLASETRAHFYNTMLQYYDKYDRQHYPAFVRWLLKRWITYKKGVL